MGIFPSEFVNKVYNLPKTEKAVADFLNADWITPDGKVVRISDRYGKNRARMNWERFEAAYVKVVGKYIEGTDENESDIYLYVHKLISRCVLAEVSPYFESDGQLFSYFQLMVRNTRINNSVKADKDAQVLLESDLNKNLPDGEEVNLYDYASALSTSSRGDTPEDMQSLMDIYKMFDEFVDEDGNPDTDLTLFGRLFVNNSYSFDGMYGLCGFSLAKFKEVKKRFISTVAKHYGKVK